MGWGSSAHGAGPHGSASPSLVLDGEGATAFGGAGELHFALDGAGAIAFGGAGELHFAYDGAGAVEFGGVANPDENYDGAGSTAFGGSAEIETGVPPDPTVTPFEFVRRVRPYEMERK